MAHAVVGVVIGLVATVAGTRLLSGILYQVSPKDPTTIAVAAGALLAVAVVACWLPARRAAAIDPVEAIRAE